MPLSPRLATWLADQGHDAVHACTLDLLRAQDALILQRARDERRIVITADLDFPRLLAFAQSRRPGLILLRSGNYSERETVTLIQRVLSAIPLTELARCLVVVDHTRLRKITLPLRPA